MSDDLHDRAPAASGFRKAITNKTTLLALVVMVIAMVLYFLLERYAPSLIITDGDGQVYFGVTSMALWLNTVITAFLAALFVRMLSD